MWRLVALVSVVLVVVCARPSMAAVAPGRVVFSVGALRSSGTFQDTGGAWRAVALPDGGAVLVAPDPMGLVAARIGADGSLDASFGTGGVTHVAVPPVAGLPVSDTSSFEPVQVLRLLDGRLVVVGQDSPTAVTQLPSAVVLRLTASGVLDPTFGDGGIARPELAVGALAALQPDGAVVVSGTAWSGSTGLR